MVDYRIYVLNADDHVVTPPHIFKCADDGEAVHLAWQYVDRTPVEVWDGATFVARLERTEQAVLEPEAVTR